MSVMSPLMCTSNDLPRKNWSAEVRPAFVNPDASKRSVRSGNGARGTSGVAGLSPGAFFNQLLVNFAPASDIVCKLMRRRAYTQVPKYFFSLFLCHDTTTRQNTGKNCPDPIQQILTLSSLAHARDSIALGFLLRQFLWPSSRTIDASRCGTRKRWANDAWHGLNVSLSAHPISNFVGIFFATKSSPGCASAWHWRHASAKSNSCTLFSTATHSFGRNTRVHFFG